MAIICRSLALLFIQAPRTGCSAIGTLLREQFDGERLLESSIRGAFSRVIVPKKHCTLDQLDAAGVLAAEDRSLRAQV